MRNTTGFKGVYYDPKRKMYEAYIRPDGKKKHLGRYKTAELAAMAYDRAALQYFGDYARTNQMIRRETNEAFLELGA